MFNNKITSIGRVGRKEYLLKLLLNLILATLLTIFGMVLKGLIGAFFVLAALSSASSPPDINIYFQIFYFLVLFVLLLHALSLSTRRLHDFSASGWYSFLILLPPVGFIFIFWLALKKGTNVINKYGKPI